MSPMRHDKAPLNWSGTHLLLKITRKQPILLLEIAKTFIPPATTQQLFSSGGKQEGVNFIFSEYCHTVLRSVCPRCDSAPFVLFGFLPNGRKAAGSLGNTLISQQTLIILHRHPVVQSTAANTFCSPRLLCVYTLFCR